MAIRFTVAELLAMLVDLVKSVEGGDFGSLHPFLRNEGDEVRHVLDTGECGPEEQGLTLEQYAYSRVCRFAGMIRAANLAREVGVVSRYAARVRP